MTHPSLGQRLLRFTAPLINLGIRPGDSDDLRLSKILFTTSMLFASLPITLIWMPLAFYFNELLVAVVMLIFSILISFGFVFFVVRPHLFLPILIYVHIVGVITTTAMSLILGGFNLSGGVVMWMLMPIIGSIIQISPRYASVFFGVFLVELALSIYTPFPRPNTHFPNWMTSALMANNLAGVSAYVTFMVYYFASQRNQALGLLRGEQEKSENLLLNILPPEIASILKTENRIIANHYEGASVLFADVVNFTPMSSIMTPTDLIELLDEVFSQFDRLTEKHGVEKIKTIGDCYMVASGVPRSRPDHAQVLARLALEMQDVVRTRQFKGRTLAFRIGINSGPVVAGVIGRKKFIYDLWGDAVNTASRMESHGAEGMIQITEATHDLIKNEFTCEARGAINVKGKGEMRVWHILGAASQ